MMRRKLNLEWKQWKPWGKKAEDTQAKQRLPAWKAHSEWCKLKQASEKSGKPCFCLSGRSSISGPSKQSSFLMQNKDTKRSIRSKDKHMKTFVNKYKAFTKDHISQIVKCGAPTFYLDVKFCNKNGFCNFYFSILSVSSWETMIFYSFAWYLIIFHLHF